MLKDQEFSQLLTLSTLFRQLPPTLQQALRQQGQRFVVPAGTTLFEVQDRCTGFVMVQHGSIRVIKPTLSGREILLYRVEPGENCILTVSCLLGHNQYPARGVAESEVVGYLLPQALFTQLLDEVSAFRTFVFQFFAERIAHLMELVEGVAFQPIEQRLAALLIERGPELETTHQQLADELGCVREVVSRHLKEFELHGFVHLTRGRIQVTNLAALNRFTAAA